MKIDSSSIGMESARSYHASKTANRHFSLMDYQQGNGQVLNGETKEGQTGEASSRKLYTVEDWKNDIRFSSRKTIKFRTDGSSFMDDFRQRTFRYIFDLLFGGRYNRLNERSEENAMNAEQTENTANADQNGREFMSFFSGSMNTMTFGERIVNFEQEDTYFSTVGTVRTSDGREINFNVNVGMSRQFQETFQNVIRLNSFGLCDPLVINLDVDAAQLSDQKFFFDIDADGTLDEISQLGRGSGYLVLDKNGDGIINDGSELFGTASGDGFADLAKYDDDGNGWIDENDAIWSKLQIWCKDETGKDTLYRLADKGVGAICLMKAATDFTLKNAQGQTNGVVRSTGVFLYENGNVGTVQHLDVAKYEQGA